MTIDGGNFTITSNATDAVFTLNASLVLDNVRIINNVASAPAFTLKNNANLAIGSNSALTTDTILSGYDEVGHTHDVTVATVALASALETEGYYMVPITGGYRISEHAIAKIGNTLYDSLASALAAARDVGLASLAIPAV